MLLSQKNENSNGDCRCIRLWRKKPELLGSGLLHTAACTFTVRHFVLIIIITDQIHLKLCFNVFWTLLSFVCHYLSHSAGWLILLNPCHLEPALLYEVWMMALERHYYLQARNSLLRYVRNVLYVGHINPLSALAIHLWPFVSFTADGSRPFKADTAVAFDTCSFFTYLPLAMVWLT